MDFVKVWVTAIVGIAVLSTVLEIILPDSDNKKYTRLVVGLIMLVILIRPITAIKDLDIMKKDFNLALDASVKAQRENVEDSQWEKIEQEFSERLRKQIIAKLGDGYEDVQMSFKLDRDRITSYEVICADDQKKQKVIELLVSEYGVSR